MFLNLNTWSKDADDSLPVPTMLILLPLTETPTLKLHTGIFPFIDMQRLHWEHSPPWTKLSLWHTHTDFFLPPLRKITKRVLMLTANNKKATTFCRTNGFPRVLALCNAIQSNRKGYEISGNLHSHASTRSNDPCTPDLPSKNEDALFLTRLS